jgi:3'-5' exoribonuclease
MAHRFINAMTSGEQLEDIFLVSQPILRSTTRGDLYIAMYLGDRTGKLNGRMWQATEAIYNSIPKEGFVRIKGRTELYQGAMQIVIDNIRPVKADQVPLDDFLPRTERDVQQMRDKTGAIVTKIKNPALNALCADFLADSPLMERFCKAPAGMVNHHGYLGGLLEHTSNMLEVAVAILPLYPKVQADLVIAGIFLHDMGKTDELAFEMAFSYTDAGQLLGHITQTAIMVSKRVDVLRARGVQFGQPLLDSLLHIILTHHGAYEFGSPKLPATAEAFMVSYIDNMDAKVNQTTLAIENEPGEGDWTPWKNSLQTRLYRKRVVD